ncbi:cation-transporting ATPase, partial [Plakobranchus ocellatus]
DEWHWQSIDDQIILKAKPDNVKKQLLALYDLCLTGEALSYLQAQDRKCFDLFLANAKVFARVAPKQKELIITALKAQGYVTLMCGDGTNDVGALKHADVGVALLANAPEKVPERKRKDENGIQGNENVDKLAKAALNRASCLGELNCWFDLKP